MPNSTNPNILWITPIYQKKIGYNRICDDLSEIMLQYLPFVDKMRFEAVSKQFQKTIFVKQRDLMFDFEMIRKLKRIPDIEKHDKVIPSLNWDGLEIMLKKFKNVNRIYFRNMNIIEHACSMRHIKKLTKPEFNSIIQLIILNYNNIIHIDLFYDKFYKHVWEKFNAKYSQSLVSIYDLYTVIFKQLKIYKTFPKLKYWVMNTHHSYNLDQMSEINEQDLELKRLKKFTFCYCCMDYPFSHNMSNHEFHFIPKLIRKNPQIKSLSLKNNIDFCRQHIVSPFKEMDIFFSLNLREFKASFPFRDDIFNNYETLMNLSRSFKSLIKLELWINVHFSIIHDNSQTIRKIMEFFKNLNNLQNLKLTLSGITREFRGINCIVFTKMLNLKSLTIHLDRFTDYFNSNFFDNCHDHFKSLKVLKLKRLKYDKDLISKISLCKNLTKLHISCLNVEYNKCKINFKKQKLFTNIKSIVLTHNDNYMPIII